MVWKCDKYDSAWAVNQLQQNDQHASAETINEDVLLHLEDLVGPLPGAEDYHSALAMYFRTCLMEVTL
jgi:hypothetical protein